MVDKLYDISDDLKENVFKETFWKDFAPEFKFCEGHDDYTLSFEDSEKKALNESLIKEGYIHIPQPGLNSPIENIIKLYDRLIEIGLPPVFSFIYDEMWAMNSQLRSILGECLDENYAMLPDFWCWRVMPSESGWGPHRDKGANSLFSDKSPKSLTVWIPLTQAHPLNGCMYILPASRDPDYGQQGKMGFRGKLDDVRALPADPGDVFVWTQHVFHWGSHSADDHDLPARRSVAFEYQRTDIPAFNSPLLNPQNMPTFEQRLALIAKQTMQYRHMYGFHDKLVALSESILEKYKSAMEDLDIEKAEKIAS